MTRIAAIDCGTNTIKLLVADLDATSGTATEVVREMRMVRLGEDVDQTGRLAEAALARLFGAVEEYAELIAGHHVDAVRFGATSAVRDADNVEDFVDGVRARLGVTPVRDADNVEAFVDGVRARLGVTPEVLSGDAEARLTYQGATRSLRDLPAPYLVVDIGGGSTELILGDPGAGSGAEGQVRTAESLDIGSVRLTERHLRSDPPMTAEVKAAVADISAALSGTTVPVEEARTVIGVAGTITTVAAGVLGLTSYDRDAIDHSVLSRADVHAKTGQLLAMTVAQRKDLGYMHPGRADVIGAGALILDQVLRETSADSLVVSEADILDGIAWSLA